MTEPGKAPARKELQERFVAGEFESAVEIGKREGVAVRVSDVKSVIARLLIHLEEALHGNDEEAVRQIRTRILSLSSFAEWGCDPRALVTPVVLPADYTGKILLVSVSVKNIGDMVCLRSNDLHHRDILKNTELEMNDLGFRSAKVSELGGAYLATVEDGSIHIGGGSDEFGPCDKEVAAALVRRACPGRRVIIEK